MGFSGLDPKKFFTFEKRLGFGYGSGRVGLPRRITLLFSMVEKRREKKSVDKKELSGKEMMNI